MCCSLSPLCSSLVDCIDLVHNISPHTLCYPSPRIHQVLPENPTSTPPEKQVGQQSWDIFFWFSLSSSTPNWITHSHPQLWSISSLSDMFSVDLADPDEIPWFPSSFGRGSYFCSLGSPLQWSWWGMGRACEHLDCRYSGGYNASSGE